MRTSAKPPAVEASRSVPARSSHKRTVTVVSTFFLATAFTLAGTPAEAVASASTNNQGPFISTDGTTFCGGGPPGPCPGGGGWSSEPNNVIPFPGRHAGQHFSANADGDDWWCRRPGVCRW
jgi:hypothetical protein